MVAGIQAKLVVGQLGDKYEQEADRVAEQVLRMLDPEMQRQVMGDVPTFALTNSSRLHPRYTCGNYTDVVSP